MPKFNGRVEILSFNTPSNKLTNALLESIRKVLLEGLVLFIEEAAKNIPVDTGMAKASLLPLARALQRTRTPGAELPEISPKPGKRKRYALGGFKSIARGESLAGPKLIDEIIKINKASGLINFDYASKVFHFNLNEFFPLNSNDGKPWNSFKKGLRRLRAYLNQNLRRRVPNLLSFGQRTVYTVSGPRFSKQVERETRQVI